MGRGRETGGGGGGGGAGGRKRECERAVEKQSTVSTPWYVASSSVLLGRNINCSNL